MVPFTVPLVLVLAMVPIPPQPHVSRELTAESWNGEVCDNSCRFANDIYLYNFSFCDDGGSGSYEYSHPFDPISAHHRCEYGTDCADCGPRVIPYPECECCAVVYQNEPGDFCGRVSIWELQNWTCVDCNPDTGSQQIHKDELCGKVSFNMVARLRAAGAHVTDEHASATDGLNAFMWRGGGVELGGNAFVGAVTGVMHPLGVFRGYRDPACDNSLLVASPDPRPFLGIEGLHKDDELMFLQAEWPPLPPAPPSPPPSPPSPPPSPHSPSPRPPPFPPSTHECVDYLTTERCEIRKQRGRCNQDNTMRNCQVTCGLCSPIPPFPPPVLPGGLNPPSPSPPTPPEPPPPPHPSPPPPGPERPPPPHPSPPQPPDLPPPPPPTPSPPPPMLPPLSPSVSSPPLSPALFITSSFSAAGTVSDYDENKKMGIVSAVANASSVDLSNVQVTVAAGSVIITTSISVTAAQASSVLSVLLTGIFSSPDALSSALSGAGVDGVNVEQIMSAPTIVTSEDLAAPPVPDNGSAIVIIGAVAGALVVVSCFAIWLLFFRKNRQAVSQGRQVHASRECTFGAISTMSGCVSATSAATPSANPFYDDTVIADDKGNEMYTSNYG
mmetsp:Transcript_83857/g.167389  ORF Transcript_83857/g.167389 Transcript_83857/m.167389 type:complete len:611 (-) Transcript_83857:400-2232(-)|eukprot:CAMPEP_0174700488 /NCGR_PEP_ID=MMETSP1094-20130205/5425_1 /TAXON_ID=156173 /ORGANISM="Chrysochromulina brevifilum, Strain UTEX LB 985" /LENGTH=610 /DNA_ID=CAMNT_0015897981 /DNA_START=37 /DNA_END=1869 /DNA_ORIENTATION=+